MHSSSVADASECLPFCECSRSENANGLMWIATGGRGLRIATCKKVPIGGVYPHYHWTDGVEVSSHHDDKDAASRLAEPPNRYSRAPGMTERPLADRLLSTEFPVSGEPLPSILVTSSAQETPDQVHVGCCGPQALAVSDGKTLFSKDTEAASRIIDPYRGQALQQTSVDGTANVVVALALRFRVSCPSMLQTDVFPLMFIATLASSPKRQLPAIPR